MKRLAILITLVAGCHNQPCATSNECGNGELCVAAHCAALACDATWYAVDPSTGQCVALPACDNKDEVRTWKSCGNPCAALPENACIADSRCQPSYSTTAGTNGCGGTEGPTPLPLFDGGVAPACGAIPKTFVGCEPVAHADDPCAGLSVAACQADPRCAASPVVGCFCPPADLGPCNCPSGPTCRLKRCSDFDEKECAHHPECTSDPSMGTGGGFIPPSQPSFDLGLPPPDQGLQPRAFAGCFERGNRTGSCFGMSEYACVRHAECEPIGTPCYCPPNTSCPCSGGKFLFCTNADGVRHCKSDGDCKPDERCDDARECPGGVVSSFRFAPADCSGVCVPKGCAGESEAQCNADPHCEPQYRLECSPYKNGGVGPGGICGPSGCGCEPTYVGCETEQGGCDSGKSILIRDPVVVDDVNWSFPNVIAAVTGADPNTVVTDWLTQLGQTTTVDGKTSAARAGAKAAVASLARLPDGRIDASKIGFQTTALSNRLDLADGSSCGEARITYALVNGGIIDRFNRMTIIVELRQPDDGAGCRVTAERWLSLSRLDTINLALALREIYAPLLTPANLKQVRTNEFLVGTTPPAMKGPPTWELREWHLGADQRLHQVLLPMSVDAAQVCTTGCTGAAAFAQWAQANRAALQAGTAVFPTQYQTPTASEDGSRIFLADATLQGLVNRSTCAGCHTTESNTAFVHVAERFRGTGRAEISQFLDGEVKKRAAHLLAVGLNGANAVLDVRPMH